MASKKAPATKKRSPSSSPSAAGNTDSGGIGPRPAEGLRLAQQANDANDFVAQMPFNAGKQNEYAQVDSDKAPLAPQGGPGSPQSADVTASTLSEDTVNSKTGQASAEGANPNMGLPGRVRGDSSGQRLTTTRASLATRQVNA